MFTSRCRRWHSTTMDRTSGTVKDRVKISTLRCPISLVRSCKIPIGAHDGTHDNVFVLLRNFQNFDSGAQAQTLHDPNPYANVPPAHYGGSFLDASQAPNMMYGQADLGQQKASYTGNEFDDEPPLLEGTKSNPPVTRHQMQFPL
jgi:hypothetical protein